MFITTAELNTHMYDEQVGEIVRANASISTTAIEAAIEEMSNYLQRYDTTAIFATAGTARNPQLVLYTKDIAVWHLIALAVPDTEYALRKERYEMALAWLAKVQARKAFPNLPLKPVDPTAPQAAYGGSNAAMAWGSNRKRQNDFS